ncbi:MAG: hypothetical protein JRI22_21770 [Deltaproteobacteria bacterium]|nr:hypothetical protein [Deltaproteobacteria bacterium]
MKFNTDLKKIDIAIFLILLVYTVLAFGIFIPYLGYYGDEHNQLFGWMLGKNLIEDICLHFDVMGAIGRLLPTATIHEALQRHFYGDRPWMYYSEIFVFHFLSAAVVFLMVMKYTGLRGVAFLAALIFLLYPIRDRAMFKIAGSFGRQVNVFLLLMSIWMFLDYLFNKKRIYLAFSLILYILILGWYEVFIPMAALFYFTGVIITRGHWLRRIFNAGCLYLMLTIPFIVYKLLLKTPDNRVVPFSSQAYWNFNEFFRYLFGYWIRNNLANAIERTNDFPLWFILSGVFMTVIILGGVLLYALTRDPVRVQWKRYLFALIIGGIVSGLFYFPFVMTTRGFNDHHNYHPFLGVSIVLSLIVLFPIYIIKNRWWRFGSGVVLGLMSGIFFFFSMMSHQVAGETYAISWDKQKKIRAQIREYMPQLGHTRYIVLLGAPQQIGEGVRAFLWGAKYAFEPDMWKMFGRRDFQASLYFFADTNKFALLRYPSRFKNGYFYINQPLPEHFYKKKRLIFDDFENLSIFTYDGQNVHRVTELELTATDGKTTYRHLAGSDGAKKRVVLPFPPRYNFLDEIPKSSFIIPVDAVFDGFLKLHSIELVKVPIVQDGLLVKLYWKLLEPWKYDPNDVKFGLVCAYKGQGVSYIQNILINGELPVNKWPIDKYIVAQYLSTAPVSRLWGDWRIRPHIAVFPRFQVYFSLYRKGNNRVPVTLGKPKTVHINSNNQIVISVPVAKYNSYQ